MKQLIIFVLIFFCACNSDNSKKTNLSVERESISKKESQLSADKSFMDFFETFMWDKNFQKSRINFPITIEDDMIIIDKSKWKHIPFYSSEEYYPILHFDTTTYFEKDIKTSDVGLIIANFKTKRITKYNFEKKANKWFLTGMEKQSIEKIPDLDFISFIKEYSQDTTFQKKHTQFPLTKLFSDPDKDYEITQTTITKEKWENFNIIKGIKNLMILTNTEKSNKYRNIYFRGVENGILVKYTFEKKNGEWMFIKLEDYSD